jgi:hypothetical protein
MERIHEKNEWGKVRMGEQTVEEQANTVPFSSTLLPQVKDS